MYCRIIKNGLLRDKATTLAIAAFIAAAAMLVSLASILAANLSGALDTLMKRAQTPHFMQMHSARSPSAWETDAARLSAFAKQNGDVEEFQIMEFMNLDGGDMLFAGKPLSGSAQDNGLSVQGGDFDFLLGLDGSVISAKDGEIYVPVCYMKDGTTKIGDKALICGREFTVVGFLRDSQMNSALSASKRFMVSSGDFAAIEGAGKTEYLIEFRLKDLQTLSAFETAYIAAGLPVNGPMVTYPLFKTLNAFSDGMMIGVILLVSLLVVAIALLCIRFTLLAEMEDDYREIGVMKGIGLRASHIQGIYLIKYAAIGLAGCIAGFALSLAFKGTLTENMRVYMGESENARLAPVFGIIGILLVFLAILAYVKAVLRRFRKISAAQAIRSGARQEKPGAAKGFRLSANRLLNTNTFLGVKDVLARKGLYATMLAVIVLASFIMVVPQNLYHTISAKSFSTYMGIGDCDLRVDIQQSGSVSRDSALVADAMLADSAFSKVNLLTTKMFRTDADEMLKVELGDHLVFPVAYSSGEAPVGQNEIALSAINADELAKQVDDHVTLVIGGSEKQFRVCGIYSDITNGGKTAKAAFTDRSTESLWGVAYGELRDKTLSREKASKYEEAFPFAKVSGIEEYIAQMFGQTIRSVKMASYAAIATALLITLLVTLLFMKMLIAKDRYSIAILKALGFANQDIAVQYAVRALAVLALGILLGTILANTLGEALAGMVISSFGVSSFKFMVNPVSAYLLCPLMMACTALVAALLGTSGAGRLKISENIKE